MQKFVLHLPFGVSLACAIFQGTMESLLQGLPRVIVCLDDVLITGLTEAEHLANLKEVLKRFLEVGIHLKKEKCTFQATDVAYLGYPV